GRGLFDHWSNIDPITPLAQLQKRQDAIVARTIQNVRNDDWGQALYTALEIPQAAALMLGSPFIEPVKAAMELPGQIQTMVDPTTEPERVGELAGEVIDELLTIAQTAEVLAAGVESAAANTGGGTPTAKGNAKSDGAGAGGGSEPFGEYLAAKAPKQVTPGTRKLQGTYKNDLGRIEPWEAHYDQFGRLSARTDYNAGNAAQGIPDTHHHVYDWSSRGSAGQEVVKHAAGEYVP
ncbi:MAG: hypothetical protein R3F14_38390, partial [Polyangiaceae bacterium]